MKYLPPVLTGILAAVSLYAANAARLAWPEMLLATLLAALIGLFFAFLFSLHKLTAPNMPFIASVFTIGFLMWYAITPIVGCIVIAATLAIGILVKKLHLITNPLIIGLTVAIVVSTGQAIVVNAGNQTSTTTTAITPNGNLPNIYFIVPDRMPSFEAMAELGIDTTSLKWQLIGKGFYVKENQLSADPYLPTDETDPQTTRTMRYMASVLNNGRKIPMNIEYQAARQLIRNPAITADLHRLGYTFYNVASWFTETAHINSADYNLTMQKQTWYDWIFTGEYNSAFWARSILNGMNLKMFMSSYTIARTEGLRHVWQAMTTVELAKTPGQKFVMTHLMLPHEPFVWTANGELQYKDLPQPELYVQQISFTCDYLNSLASDILAADSNAIIIIQSDEGMAYRKPVELNYDLTPTQWNGVFTAWRLPWDDDLAELPHTGILNYVLGKLNHNQ